MKNFIKLTIYSIRRKHLLIKPVVSVAKRNVCDDCLRNVDCSCRYDNGCRLYIQPTKQA